jgi:hypothetical protein
MVLIRKSLQRQKRTLPLLLISLFLSSCAVTIPDIEVCASGYSLENGATCVHSQTDQIREMTAAELVAFLESSPTKAPALCMSAQDYSKLRTAIEQLCHRQGQSKKRCRKEVQKSFNRINEAIHDR